MPIRWKIPAIGLLVLVAITKDMWSRKVLMLPHIFQPRRLGSPCFDTVETREIQYAEGLRYPHLERIPGTHGYLTEILAPRSDQGH